MRMSKGERILLGYVSLYKRQAREGGKEMWKHERKHTRERERERDGIQQIKKRLAVTKNKKTFRSLNLPFQYSSSSSSSR